MGIINQLFNRWKLRTTCSCGVKAQQLDDRNFLCPNGCGVYDGAEEFIQQKILVKEAQTIPRSLS